MLIVLLSLLASSLPTIAAVEPREQLAPSSLRVVDVNGDGRGDLIENFRDGSIEISLGIGERQFEAVLQELPQVHIEDLVWGDWNRDGFIDLYLVSSLANLALQGSGDGLFAVATDEFGLADSGVGRTAELRDIDGDKLPDLLLHNESSDVLFWGVELGFERAGRTPPMEPVLGGLMTSEPTPLFGEEVELIAESLESADRVSESSYSGAAFNEVGAYGDGEQPVQAATGPIPIHGPAAPVETLRFPKHHIGVTAEQQRILNHMSIAYLPDGVGGLMETIRISGVNVQIVNGLNATNGNPMNPGALAGAINGLGNLIVGYNELGNPHGDLRIGSHNLVVGHGHSYRSFGGLVVAQDNYLETAYTSVTGGRFNYGGSVGSSVSGGRGNTASGDYASVSGGRYNVSSGYGAAISGGSYGLASGIDSAISGGALNTTTTSNSSISGGVQNVTYGTGSSVSGGWLNAASGTYSSVSGGSFSNAGGLSSSISGGRSGFASGTNSSISGGYVNFATNTYSTVNGGQNNSAVSVGSTVSGGHINTAYGTQATVSGGRNRTTSGSFDWVAGSLFQND